MPIGIGDKICERIANALGFSHVSSLRLEIRNKEPVGVTITRYVTLEEAAALCEVLEEYHIECVQVREMVGADG